MIIIPIFSRPKSFIKNARIDRELVRVDFKVNTFVNFTPELRYGFQSEITISGKEYRNNRRNIEEYVIDKIKELPEYKKRIKECIEKENNKREYIIDNFIVVDESPNYHYIESTVEEYIPRY